MRHVLASGALVLAACAGSASLLGAARWEPQTSGVTGRLRGVSAVSETVAWASGAGGTVLRTVDAGKTWTRLPVPGAEKLDFRDVDAIDDRTAWVLSIGKGESSRIYKTTDAGAHWTGQFLNTDPEVFLDAMTLANADHGVAIGDSINGQLYILTTANGGQTWTRVPEGPGLPPALANEGAFAASGSNVAFLDATTIVVGTSTSRVLKSNDGGKRWVAVPAPLATNASTGIFSIAFRDLLHGVVVGGDYRKEAEAADNLAISDDGGTTWTAVKERALSGFRSAVAHVPGSRSIWVAVGPRGCDQSTDDGRTWSPLACDGFDAISFARGHRVAWATGAGGRISRLDLSE
jgi:photosystem II stability/assembly factor-like uncharacterized protein